MWKYDQRTGSLYNSEGTLVSGACYSGHGLGKNNPDMQDVPNVGPLPRGLYTIEGPPYSSPTHGPYILRLKPDITNMMFGRSGFLMHGDSLRDPGGASQGCIIAPRNVRGAVWDSGVRQLEVV